MTRVDERGCRIVCQAVSLLLQYPDRPVREAVPVVAAALAELPAGAPRTAVERFLARFEATPQGQLAEHYVATFDRDRRCCLHLTWWTDGDTRRRGGALAALKDRYRRHGLLLSGGELPDYLPVVLEYAATGDLADGLAVLAEHRAAIELVRLALGDLRSPYGSLLEAVCALLPGPSPADYEAARRLARTPPPVETVGVTIGGQR